MSAQALLQSGSPNYGAADLEKADKEKHSHVGNSCLLTAGIIIANTGGAAALDMPSAFAGFGGWLPGCICTILMTFMNVHLSIIVWRLYMCFPEETTYAGVVRQSFGKTSPTLQNFMTYAAAITQYGYCFTVMAWNLLSLGDGAGFIFSHLHVCLPILMLIWLFISIPFQVTMRNVGSWKSLILANFVFATLMLVIPLLYFVSVGVKNTRSPGSVFDMATPLNLGGMLSGASTVCYMLTTQYLVVEFAQEMRDPEEFPRSYWIAAPYQIIVYVVCGFVGYYFLGTAGTGMMLDYMPFGSALTWSAVGFEINALLVILISGAVLCKALHKWIDSDFAEDGSARDWTWWSSIVVIVLALAYLFGNLVPFFTDLVNLLGTTIAPLSCYVIPVAAYVRGYRDFGDPDRKLSRISKWEWGAIAIEFVIALSLVSYGTYVQLSKIISNWASYGYPFQCHCELLWATCECSASRPGMEMCYANATLWHPAM